MKRLLSGLVAAVVSFSILSAAVAAEKKAPEVLKHKMKALAGKEVDLSKYKGDVVLIVNVASKCGLTPQYEGLQALHEKYGDQGLKVLGFPCNQFAGQEPGTEAEIAEFCTTNYGVKFDMFSKVEVNGDGQCDLYRDLTSEEAGAVYPGPIKWNFEKFLVDRDGNVIARFEPRTTPESDKVTSAIEKALDKK